MKPVREWDEAYVLSLPLGEFDWLEIKNRRGLDLTMSTVREGDVRENMAKAVSAFANSGGGQLVYGLINPTAPAGKWIVDDGGILTTVKGKTETREWLEDIIPNLVEFPLSLFNVYAILPSGPDSQLALNRAIYIIDIGDSPQAPHQSTYDNRYYARVGGKSRPLGHRLVSDIMGRRQHPKIELEFATERKFIKGQPSKKNQLFYIEGTASEPTSDVYEYELNIWVRNNGRVFAQYVNCFTLIPVPIIPLNKLRTELPGEFKEIEGKMYLRFYKENTIGGGSRYDPILPGLAHSWTIYLKDNIDLTKMGDLVIRWETFADNSSPIEGQIKVKEIKITDYERPLYYTASENEDDD